MSDLAITPDPVESAKEAGLRYVTDAKPGFTRRRHGKTFRYLDAQGKPLRDEATLKRIRSLVIPPAWNDVWICPSANGHLQATGRDARGRKQSRYHPRWREVRDETKYERMLLFGAALPRIRERLDDDIAQPGLPRAKVLATIVRLMETTSIRVGNEEYARENHSYGLTTLRNRHVQVKGSTISFTFAGKSGKRHSIAHQDRRLARIVQRCQDLPGQEMFQYLDEQGDQHPIDSSDVNDYLREISGEAFTAKDFRTWAGTVTTCRLLRELAPFTTATEAKKNVVEVIKSVAAHLGNTPSVCRKCYVHPVVLETYLAGAIATGEPQKEEESCETREEEEQELLKLLEQKLKSAA